MTFFGLPFVLSASTVLVLILSQAEDRGSRLRAFLFSVLGVLSMSLPLFLIALSAR